MSMSSIEDLERHLELAGQYVRRARIFYDLLWFYRGPTRDVALDTMNVYSEFFRFDEHAHLVSMITYLHILYENRDDTVKSKENCKIFKRFRPDVDLSKPEFLIKRYEHLSKKIIRLRNEAISHKTSKYSFDDVFRKVDIRYDELRNLTEISLFIVNRLRVAIDWDEIIFHEGHASDLEDMLAKLSK